MKESSKHVSNKLKALTWVKSNGHSKVMYSAYCNT